MPHYFSEKQSSILNPKKISATIRGKKFEFYTGSGVFSKSKIDKGTELLANSMIVNNGSKVLDIGCGIGIIGIIAASLFRADVLMIDINERALHLSRLSLKLNNITTARVEKSNLYENVHERFDAIIVNPPQKAGKKVCYEIIEKSFTYLKEEGTLQLVARHSKGGKDLSNKMKEVFGNGRDIAKKSGYRVYLSVKA